MRREKKEGMKKQGRVLFILNSFFFTSPFPLLPFHFFLLPVQKMESRPCQWLQGQAHQQAGMTNTSTFYRGFTPDYSLFTSHFPFSTSHFLHIGSLNWKSKDNFCSLLFLAFNANSPMVIFNHLLALEQANPQPGLLCTLKRFE